MRSVSIRTVMAFVLASAVGLAALRNANDQWAGILPLVTLAAVGVALLGAILTRGRERAWWLGCCMFIGGYLAAAITPWQHQLGTTHLLEYVHARVVGASLATFTVSRGDRNSILYRVVTSDGRVKLTTVSDRAYRSTPQDDLVFSALPADRWRSAFPGAANHDPFLRVGQCLFALLAGLMGGLVALWFYGRCERVETRTRII
jgi:hypothetical protein